MVGRTIRTLSVEARAFKEGAVKVRHFDSVDEADDWIAGLRLRHGGVASEVIEHRVALGVSAAPTRPADREWKPEEPVNEGLGFGISGDENGGPRVR
jgi:hypothetical protein